MNFQKCQKDYDTFIEEIQKRFNKKNIYFQIDNNNFENSKHNKWNF